MGEDAGRETPSMTWVYANTPHFRTDMAPLQLMFIADSSSEEASKTQNMGYPASRSKSYHWLGRQPWRPM